MQNRLLIKQPALATKNRKAKANPRRQRREKSLVAGRQSVLESGMLATLLTADCSRLTHMRIGIISDTHSFLDPRVAEIFVGVGSILHAGDIGPHTLLLELGFIAPVTAVLGNTDMGLDLRLTEVVELGGKKFLIHHIVDPFAMSDDLQKHVRLAKPDVIVYGHTHKRFYGRSHGAVYLNPGYSGRPKHAQERTVAILDTATP